MVKLWLSIYIWTTGGSGWSGTWISGRKHWQINNCSANRKARKWKDHKIHKIRFIDNVRFITCAWNATKLTRKSLIKTYLRDLKTHISSVMENLRNSVSSWREVFVHISKWIAGKDAMKCHYPQRKNSTTTWQWRDADYKHRHWLEAC